jgi:hypothetical protein
MGSSRELVRFHARRKGWNAFAMGAVTVATTVSAVSLGAPIIAGLAAVSGTVLTGRRVYEWLRYRGVNGLRF